MNILILSWRDPKHPLAGGAEQVTHEHAKGWIAAGHTVYLFSSRFQGAAKEETLDGVNILRSGHEYLGVQIAACFYYLRNQSKFDLVFDQFHGLPFFTPLYIRIKKLAVIQEVAKEVWFMNELKWPLSWIFGLLGYVLEPLIFKIYTGIPFWTGSPSTKKDLVNLGIKPDRIYIINHAIKLIQFKKIHKNKQWTIMFLGALSKDKGIEDALKCYSFLDKLGDFRFWVIGKPQTTIYTRKLKKLAARFGISKKVKFWGYVSEKDKFKLLSRSHLLINPSAREGWGLVNIEANSVGTPVMAYSSPGLVDSVKHGISGVICKDNTPLELANNILNLLNDQKKYSRLKKGALAWSKKFTWEKSKKMSLKLIEKVAYQHHQK
ncbi:glycosyltransferase [Candidatus Daviesbacteria bacterium]|nr:glycosyltransferase [Candidatus Daviesbacteria bacterium]